MIPPLAQLMMRTSPFHHFKGSFVQQSLGLLGEWGVNGDELRFPKELPWRDQFHSEFGGHIL